MPSIYASVGRDGVNRPEDVKTVQQLLNQRLRPSPNLDEDGKISPETLAAIHSFQSDVLHFVRSDGRVDPDGRTLAALTGAGDADEPQLDADVLLPPVNPSREKLSEADFARAASDLNCEVACVKAVTEVESGKSGFFPSGRPKILFEAHHFGRLTLNRFDASHPNISCSKWNRSLYKRGEMEYDRLLQALSLDRLAALQAASWGRFQIMGFNFKESGFASVDAYVEAMFESEGRQLAAFVSFIKNFENTLATPLREKRWAVFAKHYNGPCYAENLYDKKLKDAYEKYA